MKPARLHDRALTIAIPLPHLSGADALELSDFLYELAGRIETSYRDCIEHHCHALNKRDLQRYHAIFGIPPAPLQLELFDDLEPF
jgi:hypothetical protein